MIYYIHNEYHLGDNIFNMILFYNTKDYIENNNILINYYCQSRYLNQVVEFVPSKNIHLFSIDKKPKKSLELWINNKYFLYNHDNKENHKISFNKFYINFFNIALNKLRIPIKLNKFVYTDKDLLIRYEMLNEKYKNIDILVLNSQPLSEQYNYNKTEWDNYIILLNKKYKIATTTKVNENVLCTMDDNLTIKNIAAVSTNVKVVIAINSGVVPGLLNYYTLTSVKQFYTFDNRCFYSYPNFVRKQKIKDISFQELDKYLSN
jgi:hypothetical protein